MTEPMDDKEPALLASAGMLSVGPPAIPAVAAAIAEKIFQARRLRKADEEVQAERLIDESIAAATKALASEETPRGKALLLELATKAAVEERRYAEATELLHSNRKAIREVNGTALGSWLERQRLRAFLLDALPDGFEIDWVELQGLNDVDLLVRARGMSARISFRSLATAVGVAGDLPWERMLEVPANPEGARNAAASIADWVESESQYEVDEEEPAYAEVVVYEWA